MPHIDEIENPLPEPDDIWNKCESIAETLEEENWDLLVPVLTHLLHRRGVTRLISDLADALDAIAADDETKRSLEWCNEVADRLRETYTNLNTGN